MNEQNTVIKALQYLAGVCDGAVKLDGAGFNAYDAAFGHELAERSMEFALTALQLSAALGMLQKYTAQLAEAGITLPAVEEKIIRIGVANGRIAIRFPGKPGEDERLWMKGRGGYWKPDLDGMPWLLPVGERAAILKRYPGAEVDVAVMKLDEHLAAPKPAQSASVTIRRLNGDLLVSFQYDPKLVEKVKSLAERKFDPETKNWKVPSRLLPELLKLFPDALLDDKTKELINVQRDLRGMSDKAASAFDIAGLRGGELMPFQRAGVEYIERAGGRALIADDMGLGKTIQALAYLQLHPEMRPAVIVVPASVKINWRREAQKWLSTPDTIEILSGRKAYDLSLSGATIAIINYDILSAWLERLEAWRPQVVILDEAHYCKNTDAARSKASMKLAERAPHVLCMTGTPITNRPAELWPLLHMIDSRAWPKFWSFGQRYCDAQNNGFGWDFSGASNLAELHEAIKPYCIRRTKAQVLSELPEKRRAQVAVEFDEAVRDEYDKLLAQAERMARATEAEQLVFIEKAKQVTARAKLPAVLDWISDFLETGEKLVVFCTHTETVEALMGKFGVQAVEITGRVKGEARQRAVDEFQGNDKIRLLVGNIRAAGEGITLTASSNVAFVEYPQTPGALEQAIDRVHRIGQRSAVTAWFLMADGTIDEDVIELLERKRQVIGLAVDGQAQEGAIAGELIKRIISRNTI